MRKNPIVPNKEVDMTSIADSSVIIQTSWESVPATPSWFGKVALIIPYLRKQGVLSAISAQVRLARHRFGHYEVIDFLTVVSQAHSYHWLGTFGNSSNGRYREELRRALTAIKGYLEAHHLSPISALLRL